MDGIENAEVVGEYVAWLASWASERTIEARRTFIRGRLEDWGGIEGMTPENIGAFLGRPNLKRWSKATYHAHLKSFCEWLVATERLAESPIVAVRAVKRPAPKPRPLSEAQVDRVLSVVQGETRDQIQLALLQGLRVSEIAKIRGEDVEADSLRVIGKGDKEETLPCHPDIWQMAQRYPRSGYWFTGPDNGHVRPQLVSRTVGTLFRAIGIEGSIHRCRHTYGTRLLRAGVNIRIVQKLMRHTNLETTATYTAVDENEMNDAIRLLSA